MNARVDSFRLFPEGAIFDEETLEIRWTLGYAQTGVYSILATDKAGNSEAASVANAVLPDDGARREVLDSLARL